MCVCLCLCCAWSELEELKFFSVCVHACVFALRACLWSELVILVVVAMDGYTAVVGDWPWHGCHPCDDTRSRVITQDGVCCFAAFPSAAEDEDLTIAH